MASLSPDQYDRLERAITDGRRIAVLRRGSSELVVVPRALRIVGAREVLDVTHPTTGERLALFVDELDAVEVVR
jgi:hypothetical protein